MHKNSVVKNFFELNHLLIKIIINFSANCNHLFHNFTEMLRSISIKTIQHDKDNWPIKSKFSSQVKFKNQNSGNKCYKINPLNETCSNDHGLLYTSI